MMISRMPKYRPPHNPDFFKTMRRRVNAYFDEHGRSRKGNAEAYAKVVVSLVVLVASYGIGVFADIPVEARFLCAFLWGVASLSTIYNISHDASHNSLFESRRLNKLFAYSANLVGSNAYTWHLTHVRNHHSYPNVVGVDGDIQRPAPMLRLNPLTPWRPIYRYQHLYAPLLYLLMSLFAVTLRDFKDIGLMPSRNRVPGIPTRHPWREYAIMIGSKVFYYTYALIIPWLVLDVPFLAVFAVFVCVHLMAGVVLAVSLIPVHASDHNDFPELDGDGNIPNEWAHHAFAASTDVAIHNRWFTAFIGGLNIHVIHHLFPGIHHVHFQALLPIMQEVADEYGVAYRHTSLREGIAAHFRFLRKCGSPDGWEEIGAGPLPAPVAP